jgi:TonB family protein
MIKTLFCLLSTLIISNSAGPSNVSESNFAAGFLTANAIQTNSAAENTHGSPRASNSDLRLEHAEVPIYPQVARSARISGTVKVEVTIKDGMVVNARLESGHAILARAAIENIHTWRFYPLVNAVFTTKFIYRIDQKHSVDPQNPRVELELPLLVKIIAAPVLLDAAGVKER